MPADQRSRNLANSLPTTLSAPGSGVMPLPRRRGKSPRYREMGRGWERLESALTAPEGLMRLPSEVRLSAPTTPAVSRPK